MNIHTVEIAQLMGPRMMREFCGSQWWFQFPQPTDARGHVWNSMADFLNGFRQATTGTKKSCLQSKWYPAPGIQKVVLLHNPSRQGFFYFVVVVNLESLIRQDRTVESFSSFTEERLRRCSYEFNRLMGNFSDVKFKALLEWSTRRVDYAVDVPKLDDVALYVSLMQHARIPRGMEQRQRYDGTYRLVSLHDDVATNFYDKKLQLSNDIYLHADDRLMREAHGLLRIEVQCQGRKLDHIRDLVRNKSLPHYGMKLRTFLNAEISNSIVQDYYSRAIGYQDYYSFQAVEKRLNEQSGRHDMKQRLLQFLRQVEASGSISAGIEAYQRGIMPDGSHAFITGAENSLQNILNIYLPRYGINPVLIPAKYNLSYLANPMPINLRIQ